MRLILLLLLCFLPSSAWAQSPLFDAIAKEDARKVKRLLERKADYTITDEYGRTPLHNAVETGQAELVEMLLKAGADIEAIDFRMMTPLHLMGWHEFPEITRLLLKHNADIEARDVVGRTPLHIAASSNNIKIVRTLHQLGADVWAQDDDGNTMLHSQTTAGKEFDYMEQVVAFFVEAGLDPNASNYLGYTPLMVAASANQVERAKLLLELGASTNMVDWRGKRAYDYALEHGHKKLARLLIPR